MNKITLRDITKCLVYIFQFVLRSVYYNHIIFIQVAGLAFWAHYGVRKNMTHRKQTEKQNSRCPQWQ